ncbi:MAG: hypothetical protein CMI04_15785 [Oceanospirillaceae bacterium]|nr:hypothetical protein [Oceanospirillaceae bacterium]
MTTIPALVTARSLKAPNPKSSTAMADNERRVGGEVFHGKIVKELIAITLSPKLVVQEAHGQ